MKQITLVCTLAALVAALAPAANAQILAQYTFPGSAGQQLGAANNWDAPTTFATGLTANKINITGSSATSVEGGLTLADAIFASPAVGATTAAIAFINNSYFQFTVTPTGGVSYSLSSLTFDASRGSASTPRGWAIRTSADGFATQIDTADVLTEQPTLTAFSVSLSASVFQNRTTPLTVRYYVYAPNPAVGLFVDNLTLNGSVAVVVPEAGTLTLFALPLVGLVAVRHRKTGLIVA